MTEPFYTLFCLIKVNGTRILRYTLYIYLIESTLPLYNEELRNSHECYVNEVLFRATTIFRIGPFVLCVYSITIRIPLLILFGWNISNMYTAGRELYCVDS